MKSMRGMGDEEEIQGRKSSEGYKGVRMRKWGRWVSEIRIPRSRSRIWLGSYDLPEKAARAYDAALYCLRGPRANFNFASEKRPEFVGGIPGKLTTADIKAIAARFASPVELPSPSPSSIAMASSNSPSLPSGTRRAVTDAGTFELDGAPLEDPLTFVLAQQLEFDTGNLWDVLSAGGFR